MSNVRNTELEYTNYTIKLKTPQS